MQVIVASNPIPTSFTNRLKKNSVNEYEYGILVERYRYHNRNNPGTNCPNVTLSATKPT
jgi:hypothetical protein